MRVYRSISGLQKFISKTKSKRRTIGFVPTMGALHEGHLSLIRKCRRENNISVVSIFVNPAQFGPHEDFKKYPRPEKKDLLLAKKERVDIIFYPSADKMYPEGYETFIDVEELSHLLCGKFRPGHFKGVATIVAKLLNIVTPHTMYLGQKDIQQAVLLKKMIRDLNMPVNIRICPIIREKDGLALSSRNSFLSKQERQEAPVIYEALKQSEKQIRAGQRKAKDIIKQIRSFILNNSSGQIQYIACVRADTLENLITLEGKVVIALAVHFGKTRLIDNIVFTIK